jgi:hypothetical protein
VLIQKLWQVDIATYLLIGMGLGTWKLRGFLGELKGFVQYGWTFEEPRAYSEMNEELAGVAMALIALLYFISISVYWPILIGIRLLNRLFRFLA